MSVEVGQSRGGHPPATRLSPVPRPRLTARLAAEPRASIAVVVAPAGYGKTTLLSQWETADERDFVWLALDQRHDDATLLIGAIAAALDKLEPLGDRVFAPLMAPRPNLWRVVIPRLCDALADRERPFVLVLDDLHRVRDHRALEPLATIAEHMPVGSRLAIASRNDPAVPLGRLRTQRGVIELRMADLAMTRPEAETLLGWMGITLSHSNLDRVLARTEGWPAGLYLAALTLEAEADADLAFERFCGDDRIVADYLREEFTATLSPEQHLFLTQASVLDRLSGPICDAVLECDGSGELLKRLAGSNLLLVPLDHRDREYRLHGLLREMLRSRLHGLGDGRESLLHRRAAAWYAEHGDVDRAIPHAFAAGDKEFAAELIWANTTTYETSGRSAVVQRWVEQFSEAEIAASPPLAVTRATSLATQGDGAGCEHWTAVGLEALKHSRRPDAELLRLAAQTIRAAVAARDGAVQMRRDVEEAYALLPDDSAWKALCCLVEGVSWHLTGDRERARHKLEEGFRRGEATAPNVGTLCLSQLALVAIDEEDVEYAEQLTEQAMAAVEHFGLGEDPTAALAFATAALARAQRGRADAASRDLRMAVPLLERLNEISAWYEVEARVVIARTLIELDDVAAARARLAEAGRVLQRVPDATVVREWIEAAWKEADTANTATDRWPLSPAELRLLHYLPTHLTFREIADQIFVSQNTVKTHARSIYRKLGVTSRAEAVARARGAGLLDGDPAVRNPKENG